MSAPWRHPGFRRLYASSAVFALGTQVWQLALPLALYELTRSAAMMSTLRATELLPNLLLAMFIGVWVDRIDRGTWARRAMAGMVVLMAVLALVVPRGASALPAVCAGAFALMTLNYVYGICRMGMVKEMLPAALLLPATGQLAAAEQVVAVVGPALAGVLVGWRVGAALWAPVAALLVAAALLRGLALPPRPVVAQPFWPAFREGVRVLRANRPLWHAAWLVVLTNGSAGVVDVLFLFRARDQLQLAPAALGLLYALGGLAGVGAGFACGGLRRRIGLGRLYAGAVALAAGAMLVLAWASDVPLLLAGLALNSFAVVIGNVCVWGYRQESTDSACIGRVSGLTGSLFKLAMPFALLASGQLAARQPLGLLMSACAAVHLVATLGLRCSAMYPVR